MPAKTDQTSEKTAREPRSLGEHARGLASEYAHEQGWQLSEEERRRQPEGMQNTYGGTNYEYGAQDFGEEPVNAGTQPSDEEIKQAREALFKEE